MAAATTEKAKPSAAEMKAARVAREAAEAEKAKSNGRAAIDAAHEALGTGPGVVPGANIDLGPQDVYDGDEEATGPLQLSFAVGGKQPTCSALTMIGGKLDIAESFRKGQKIVLRVELEVGEVAFKDQTDAKTGQVVGCERRHKARVVGHRLLEV